MQYFVYIIQSESGSYYVGQTNDLEARLKRHNGGNVRSTKNKGVWTIVHQEEFTTRAEAMKRLQTELIARTGELDMNATHA